MIHKTSFSEMAKKVFRHERGLRDLQIMHPEREWLVGLLVMVLVFATSATWSAQVYLKNKNVSAAPTTTGEGENVYREPQVKEALRIAQVQEDELRGLLGAAPTAPPAGEETRATSTATTTTEMEEGNIADEIQATSTLDAE